MPDALHIAYVVSQTHWDREWYKTFQQFRMRLVALTDELLDLLERDPDYKFFYWDGQTVVIEDYLEIRSENAERLRKHFASGRLYTGPWFVQPDEFLVSGEAFVRNLLLGRRMCAEWGTGAAVGYAPDAFGHTSQMPQILRGFGLDNAILFRGITTDQVDSEFTWQAPDGSEVLCIKMPDDNAYSCFFYRFRETLADTDRDTPLDPEQVAAEATALLEDSLAARPNTRYLLWMDGVDHIFAQPRTPEIIRLVNERLGDRVQAVHSTLPAFLEAVRAAEPKLKTVVGELRVSNRAWRLQALLTHVASSRIHLKQRNHRCETLLERWAEPWNALAWQLGRPYPDAFLRYAWKQLLLNQPHDSLCGCSIDQVHKDMLYRYDQCLQVGEQLAADAMEFIADRVHTLVAVDADPHPPAPRFCARSNRASLAPKNGRGGDVAALVVFNPLGWHRQNEVLETVIELPAQDAPEEISIVGPDGAAIPCFIARMCDYHLLTQAPHDIPVGEHRKRWEVRFLASAPAFGYATYSVIGQPASESAHISVQRADGGLENEYLRVEVAPNGSLTLTDKATGRVFRGLLVFESGGDFGDGWNYIRPKEDVVFTTEGVAAGVGHGISWSWIIPAGRKGDTRDRDETQYVWIYAKLLLAPGAKRLNITLDVTNEARDHRLRVLFPTGLSAATHSHAEQAYDVVARPIQLPDCAGWKEPQPPTGPQKTFVDVSDGTAGLCLINKGIPEYEVKDDPERTLALTLLRCVGGGVGRPEDQEEGQMIGDHTFEFALLPHAGDWEAAQVWRETHNFNVPLRAVHTGVHDGPLPAQHSFLSVGPDSMVPTAVKRSEDGAALVVRAVNYASQPVAARFGNALGLSAAQSARLDETPTDALDVQDNAITIEAPSRRIVTVRFNA